MKKKVTKGFEQKMSYIRFSSRKSSDQEKMLRSRKPGHQNLLTSRIFGRKRADRKYLLLRFLSHCIHDDEAGLGSALKDESKASQSSTG